MDGQLTTVVHHNSLFEISGAELDYDVEDISGVAQRVADAPRTDTVVATLQLRKGQTYDHGPQIIKDP